MNISLIKQTLLVLFAYILQNSSPVMILYMTTIKRSGRNVNMNKKQSRHNMKPNIINWKTKQSRNKVLHVKNNKLFKTNLLTF